VEAKRKEAEAVLDKMFAAYDLKPHPLPAIPDDPPPHQGAMIGYPIVIEPPDLLLVEVLEALPGRGGKPARVYKVDLEAIRDKGDATSNYENFPGDRLVVGRNDVVKKTIQVDRLAAGMQTVVNSIMQESFLLRSLKGTSPENHEAILKELVDFWIQEMKRPDGVQLDEQTLREALIRRVQVKPGRPAERK